MKYILFGWAVTVSLALILVLMLKLQPPCSATAEDIKASEIACNGEVRYWMYAYSSTYENFKTCSTELRFELGLDNKPQP